jgi:hypothetical protein
MKKVVKRKLPLEKTIVKCLTVDPDDPRRGELAHVVGGSIYPACPTSHVSAEG